jgi:quinol monooxygenase YgiN
MSVLIVVVTLKPEPQHHDAMREVLSRYWPAVQQEEGCELYALHENDDIFVAVERWSSREIWNTHLATEGNAKLVAELTPLLAEPIAVHALAPVPLGDPAKSFVH